MLSLSHPFEICGDVNISGMGGFESSHSKLSDSIGMSWSPHESSFDAKKIQVGERAVLLVFVMVFVIKTTKAGIFEAIVSVRA